MKTSIHSWNIRICKISLNTTTHFLQVMALGEKSKLMLKKLSMEEDNHNFEDSFKKFIIIRMHIWNWCRGSINLALLLIQEQLFQYFKRINYHLSPVSRTTTIKVFFFRIVVQIQLWSAWMTIIVPKTITINTAVNYIWYKSY